MGPGTSLTTGPRRTSHGLELLQSCEEIVCATPEPARRRSAAPLPTTLHPDVLQALERGGIEDLHDFQRSAIDALLAGDNVSLAGGTGSGKSLCYQAPLLHWLREQKRATALYLAPTKALAQDQARRLRDLRTKWAVPALYDGDTPQRQRAIIRRTANLVLTNPDMLSAGMLPRHAEWARFFAGLQIVVIDEAHVYRGVFGSHVAQVLRRLRRICAHYGAEPVFVASSGTIANPGEHLLRLTGAAATVIGDEGAPSSGRDLLLWNPELDDETGSRASPLGDAARIYSLLIEEGVATIVFARTRKSCELIHRFARDRLIARGRDDLATKIAPYRAGYTPEERRATERALAQGELLGVVATNALELGIDIGTLEASICVTFPGTVTSLRQQWGRAGRGSTRGCCILVAGEDALDQYFMREPETLLQRPVEQAVVSTTNTRITVPHLAAAACELPLQGHDADLFGATAFEVGVRELLDTGRARTTPAGISYVGRDHPAGGISLRSSNSGSIAIVERETGVMLGTVEHGRAPGTVYPGAIYLHRGESYIVHDLDFQTSTAIVSQRTDRYYTLPKMDTDITILGELEQREICGVTLRRGTIEVREQLVAYQRKSIDTHTVIDLVPQLLPPQEFGTEAIWFAPEVRTFESLPVIDQLGALHAAEHGMIALLPLIAMCDRNDIGGLSTDWHQQVGAPTIFVYDGHDGGVGITEAGYAQFERWIEMSAAAIEGCPCDVGCPSCVQSPKCGNLNDPLHKQGALGILRSLEVGVSA